MKDANDIKGNEARLYYSSGSYKIIIPGDYVTCAQTGSRVLLEELAYWSHEHQEAYVNADAASKAWSRHHNQG